MKYTISIVLVAVILSFLFNVVFGRWLGAELSTWPILSRVRFLSPQAPIILTQREEIRLSDAGQFNDAILAAKSKISSIFTKEKNSTKFVTTAVNLTKEGLLVVPLKNLIVKTNLFALLSDGNVLEVIKIVEDPATGLAFLQLSTNNIPVADLAETTNLQIGEKLVFFSRSLSIDDWKAWPDWLSQKTFVTSNLQIAGKSLSFLNVANTDLEKNNSAAVLGMRGQVVGLVSEGQIVSGEVIRAALAWYNLNEARKQRADFGFTFMPVSGADTAIFKTPSGFFVTDASKQPLLKNGDIITKINNAEVPLSQNPILQVYWLQFKAGDSAKFLIFRDNQNFEIVLKAKELR